MEEVSSLKLLVAGFARRSLDEGGLLGAGCPLLETLNSKH